MEAVVDLDGRRRSHRNDVDGSVSSLQSDIVYIRHEIPVPPPPPSLCLAPPFPTSVSPSIECG